LQGRHTLPKKPLFALSIISTETSSALLAQAGKKRGNSFLFGLSDRFQ
jgi:hypothetical protein